MNVASRMESTGIPGHIQVTQRIYDLMRTTYVFQERGEIDIKGKGFMKTHFVLSRKNRVISLPVAQSEPSTPSAAAALMHAHK